MHSAVIVGCGNMSQGWLESIKQVNAADPRIEIVGFVDLDIDAAKSRAASSGYDQAICGTDLKTVLSETGADIVFDIVVPAARVGVVTTAFEAGCDVLSEKPMGNSMAEARALLAAREKSGRMHAVVQNRRHLTGIHRVRSFLESGAIGQIAEVHCDFFLGPHFGGFREEMEHVLLHDMAIHTFDAARFIAELHPKKAYCHESNPAHSWFRHGASAIAIFDCADNVTMSYRGSWCAEGASTSWESSWRIVGSRGSLIWDGNEGFRAEIAGEQDDIFNKAETISVPELSVSLEFEGHAGVIADFLNARETGRPALTDSRDNIYSLAMTFAAIESAERGTSVEINV